MMIIKGRVLLVDDEPLVLEIIDSALKKEGYEVVCAPNSKNALHHLEKTDFDGLVCDVRLENLDGFDVLAIARKKNPGIGAVLMTGAPTPEDAEQARALKVTYLSKPIGMGELIACIDRAVEAGQYLSDPAIAA